MKNLRTLILLLFSLFVAGAAGATELWLHVHVDESGEGGAKVRVNLPLNLVETAVAMVPDEHFHGGRVKINDADFSVAQLRALWREVEASPDATFVEVEEGDQRVQVSKSGGYLLVHTLEPGEDGETVDVRIPAPVVEALLSGEGEEFDIAAAIRALAVRGEGELVTVHDGDAKVRVWVDASAEAL